MASLLRFQIMIVQEVPSLAQDFIPRLTDKQDFGF